MVQEGHQSSDELEAYALGLSSDADLEKVEEHLLICEPCQNELALTDQYRLAECFFEVKDRTNAVNEFREALNGDLQPPWIKVWSHVNRGKIFDVTGQRERALNEYRLAEETKDNTRGAQDEVAKYRETPYHER